MADLSPEASNAFKLPIFEISILKDEKSPHALLPILSPGDARGVLPFYPHRDISRTAMGARCSCAKWGSNGVEWALCIAANHYGFSVVFTLCTP
jgi:hypothetical protein